MEVNKDGLLTFVLKGSGESTPFRKYLATFKSAKVVNFKSAATVIVTRPQLRLASPPLPCHQRKEMFLHFKINSANHCCVFPFVINGHFLRIKDQICSYFHPHNNGGTEGGSLPTMLISYSCAKLRVLFISQAEREIIICVHKNNLQYGVWINRTSPLHCPQLQQGDNKL